MFRLFYAGAKCMPMGTIIFDFDSTIVSVESLEWIVARQCEDPVLKKEFNAITEEGLRGKIPFAASLERRLAIAAPTRKQVIEFGNNASLWLTTGMEDWINELHAIDYDVWIVSGALIEALTPLAKQLHIPKGQIHGVKLNWNRKGEYVGVDKSIPFFLSKVEGCRALAKYWKSPTIAVGDSISDYRLYSEGLVEHFIAFTEHFRCKEVLEKGCLEAGNVAGLKKRIAEIING